MITEVPLSKLLPPDSKPALFAQRADATLKRCKEIYSNRGDQYGDTWRDCQWLKLKAILFTMFGMKPTVSQCRAMALASLADVKYSRFLGGYNEDHVIDGINYDAALAEEMREIYKEASPPRREYLANDVSWYNEKAQVRVNGEWKDL